ncbi:MAG: glycosyltransferase [Candidatus Omnitrophota bacterium]
MTKICFIIDNLKIAGAQRHLLRLTKGLTNRGYSPEVISLGINDENLIKEIKAPLATFKMDCIWRMSFWLNFIQLIKFISKQRPVIVHTYLNTSNVFGVLSAKIAKVPIIFSSRRDLGQFRSRLIGLLERFTAHLSDKVVCVSNAVQNHVIDSERISREKTAVIYNGVDVDSLRVNELTSWRVRKEIGIGENELAVGMIATMDREEKGHKEFIEAAGLVVKEIPNVKFLLIGDGFLRQKLENAIRDTCLAGRQAHDAIRGKVLFLGKRNGIPELLSTMDVSVNASYSEGMSNTILESMAAGVPVVATAIDGNLETVKSLQFDYSDLDKDYSDKNCATGILVPPKEPQAMAKAIIKILKDKELAVKMGENARRLVYEKFSLETMVNNYAKLYQDLSAPIRVQNNPRQSASTVGYIVSLFPCWSETFILNEIIELKRKGIEVTIFSIRKDLEAFIQEKSKLLIKNTIYPEKPGVFRSFVFWAVRKPVTLLSIFWLVVSKRYSSSKVLLKNIWCIFVGCYFATIVKKENIKNLHAHFATYPTLVALVISRLTKISYTFTNHAHDIFLEKALLKEKSRDAKAIVAISNYNKQYLDNICQNGVIDKTHVIHCGLDLAEFVNLNVKHKDNTILSIGRLTKMKGFEYLIKACNQIKNRLPVQCRIIGDGPLNDELERLIINLGVRSSVKLKGVTDNSEIKQLLQESAVFIMSSVWDEQDGQDGIPIVLMEAMAAGVPVIGSNISGIPELIQDGQTGLLVEPGNVVDLAKKIELLLNDKDLQARLAKAGRRKVEEEFDIHKSVEKLIEVFNLSSCHT